MGAYSYQALDPRGKKVKGVLEGDSERQVRNMLRGRDLKPLEVRSVRGRPSAASGNSAQNSGGLSGLLNIGGPRMNRRELSLLTRQLASLIQSGLPLDEVLAAAGRQARKPNVKSIVMQVRSRVVEGLSLAQAMAESPKVFDNLYRAMIRAGETAGYLGPVLEQLAEYTERGQETAHKLKSAMIYPIVMLIVSMGIVTFMMVKVVPQLIGLFESNSRELPGITKVLIGTSDFMINYGLWLALLICVVLIGLRSLLQNESRLKAWHRIQLKIPMFGNFILQAETARYASTLGLLASSGVPLLEALKIASQVLNNRVMQAASNKVAIMVQEGTSLSKALDQVEVFPPLLVQMTASGEANGKVAEQLLYAARNEERELEFSVNALMSLMEPAMILLMATLVGFIVMAILMPIFEMNDISKL